MPWLSIITAFAKLASVVATYLARKQLIDAGIAKARSEHAEKLIKNLERVRRARANPDRRNRMRKRWGRPQ